MKTQQEKAKALISQANELRAQGKLEQAIYVYQKAIELIPAYNSLQIVIGDMYQELQQYEKAIEVYQAKMDQLPAQDQAWGSLGQALLLAGRDLEASEALERAVKLHPGDALSWYYRAMALIRIGEEKKAINHLRQALKLRPDWADRASSENTFAALYQAGVLKKPWPRWQFWRRS